jgi:multidrug transporter EmrE-like cation transporter
MPYIYIILTILLTVYGQIVVKWQVMNAGQLPENAPDKVVFLFRMVTNLWVLSSFLAAFLAAVSWMAAMTKFELSYAYPFMSASFVLVFACSALLFNEQVTVYKVTGLTFIVIGIIISGR